MMITPSLEEAQKAVTNSLVRKKQIETVYGWRFQQIHDKRLLFVMNEGASVFPYLESFTVMAKTNDAIRFTGNLDFFEFFLTRPNDSREFSCMKDLDKCLYVTKRFTNSFSGVVCVDITDWIGHFDDTLFSRFLGSLECHDKSTVFAFSLYCGDKTGPTRAEQALTKSMRIQTIVDPAWRYREKGKQTIGFDLATDKGVIDKDEYPIRSL